MKVLVNGIGNIGTTILNLLAKYKDDFGIHKIYAVKNTITPWNKIERNLIEDLGIIICSSKKEGNYSNLSKVLHEVDYLFETTANGIGLENLANYREVESLKASAQGSEKGFGIPFMSGINEDKIKGERFVNIVSCNTHGTASLLRTFTGRKLENLKSADFVVVRRSEDLGNHERLVTSSVIARHLDSIIGTHHAIDVVDMFKTINVKCKITSSDITTPSQLMHSLRFNIDFNQLIDKSILDNIKSNPYLAVTKKFDSNIIFELGRRYGFQGRIFSHAIIVSENLLLNKKNIKGWAFIPQEGNTILSTIHAFLIQMEINNAQDLILKIQNDLLKKEW